ncbi:trypsin-like peptidase domain-containing protein [Pseudoalteromonas rubra]|uniref:Serine protease n=1 Tax=Pseudoalteromonas rubra TaxID=43658 RepID=A0A0F4QNM5_9GAMM|nr:trypsin-like peptidase domain-containing protein [Pseudoalteromonas rubra]KJZ08247.1 serine protease [Pseudoalteromonas rubra]
MFKLLKLIIPPVFIGLGLALIIIWFTPELRQNALRLELKSHYTAQHMSFASGVNRAAPAVVSIFSESFSNQPRFKRQNTVQELGSGVIMSREGYILTNYHVVNNADQIIVLLPDGRLFNEVQLVGYDTITDLALLKIKAEHLPVIPVDDTFSPQVGDVVLAIGNPLNLGQTITQGIISATGKQTLTDSQYNSLLQMDAAVNMGNSGGALVNSNGDLVGITSAQFRARYNIDIQGISFAVPYSLAKDVMAKLIKDGRVIRGYLGFRGTPVDNTGQEVTNVYTTIVGLRISDLDPLGPAWQAGMKENDIVTKVAGEPVKNPQQTLRKIGNTAPGTQLEFEVYRGDRHLTFMVEVAELETPIY